MCDSVHLVVVEDVSDLLEAVLDLAREGVLAQEGEARRRGVRPACRGQHEAGAAAAAEAPRALRRPRGAPGIRQWYKLESGGEYGLL